MHLQEMPDLLDEAVQAIKLQASVVEEGLRDNPNISEDAKTQIISSLNRVLEALEKRQDGLLHISSVELQVWTLALCLRNSWE